jgi:L-alanine-DL-glutamate epimerase-like enolase superfamily enzyme
MIGPATDNGVTMKITDLKCAVIGGFPVVRITTDEGIDGIGYSIYV